MSDSDTEDLSQLSARELKEVERRRRKNKKKKGSKKRNDNKTGTIADATPASEDNQNGEDQGEEGQKIAKDVPMAEDESAPANVEVEYVGEELKIDEKYPDYSYFEQVFKAFKVKTEEELKWEEARRNTKRELIDEGPNKAAISEQILQEEMSQRRKEAEAAGEAVAMSRRKTRLAMQPTMVSLKSSTTRPDVVEWADVTSRDPFLLVELKAYRNTVPVPRHWNAKRKYLAGKRGFERAPFELPDFIKRTGIMEMRESMWEKEDHQSLKSKMRERARPKLGRIDIDYQKLHDAFFKWQTKPVMSRMGEIYYEGKEQEAQMREKKPGMFSDELRIALGMPVGPNANKFPPPWLIAMQRYGPPPSYPNLKIPGLNSPIPEGCAFGYHAGGWGKPPVDEYGKPLYGDVFGVETPQAIEVEDESVIERRHWGEIGSEGEEESDDSDMDNDEEEMVKGMGGGKGMESGFTTPANTEGFATPSGITTVPGVETPDSIELRKRKTVDESLAGSDTPAGPLYTVVPEKKVDRFSGQLMGSSHVYDLSSRKMPLPNDGVEVSLNPEELDNLDQRGYERKYEEGLRKQNQSKMNNEEDLSDMVREHTKQNSRKRKPEKDQKKGYSSTSSHGGGSSSSSSSQKKYKDFKF